MPTAKVPSFMFRKETIRPQWHHVDATDQVLGRLAVKIATVLMGKHRPTYTPHVDSGDFVVVTNAEKVKVTGNKGQNRTYTWYTYHPGGFRKATVNQMLAQHPERVLTLAVRRMLPKTALGRQMLKKLKVYAGATHPHSAQQPQPWAFSS